MRREGVVFTFKKLETQGNNMEETVTKKALISKISHKCGTHPDEVKPIVQSTLDCIIYYLSCGKRLEFRDFGVFEIVTRKKKIGRNPKNATVSIVIPERKAVKFTPGKKMKNLIETETETEKVEQGTTL